MPIDPAGLPGDWWDKLVVSLELADLSDDETRDRLDSAAAKANNQGVQTAAAWRYGRALPMLTAAVEIWTRLEHVPGIIGARTARGAVYRKVGDFDAAREDHATALALAEDYGLLNPAITARIHLGAVLAETGDLDQAEALLRAAFDESDQVGDNWGAGHAQRFLGHVFERRKTWGVAYDAYAATADRWAALQAPAERIEATAGMARAALARGYAFDAYALGEQVLDHLGRHGPARLDEPLRVYWTLYRILHLSQQPDNAHDVLRMAYAMMVQQMNGLSPAQRALFREAVTVNRDLAAAWMAVNAEDE